MNFKRIILFWGALSLFISVHAIEIKDLRCELMINPEGISTTTPRFNWIIKSNERNSLQTSYQILASSSPEKLNEKDADLWNSGVIKSDQSTLVKYTGKALKSRDIVYWTVKVTTNKETGEWSAPAHFSVG